MRTLLINPPYPFSEVPIMPMGLAYIAGVLEHNICDEIMDRGLKFNWKAFSRVDTVNPEVMLKLKEAGCTYLCYGVESGNQHILDTVKKKTTLDKIREGVRMARDAGISVQAAFILGLPGETKETLIQTMQFAQELDTFYGLHVLAPFPGTEVREKAKRRSPLAWALLRGDVIENVGMMELKGDAVEHLASRLAEIVRYPCHQVSESIKRWMSAGLLKYEVQSKHLVWRWS